MQEHELTELLGDAPATDEQRAALHRASDMVDARYHPDLEEERREAFNAALALVLDDADLGEYAAAWTRARQAEREAMAALTGAIIAASATTSEVDISRITGINRMTIRKALGK